MPKVLRYALIIASALIALFIFVAVFIATTFDPNAYKPLIIKTVKDQTQRTLSIPGTMHLTFFPRIGADLGQVVISEHGSNAEFASVNSAKVSVALIPLLSKRVVVDRVIVDGLHANIKRNQDGTTNFDDLTSKDQSGTQASSGGQTDFNIGGIDVTNSSVVFDDRQGDSRIDISDLNLHTGKIADGTKSDFKLRAHVMDDKPAIDATVSADSDFLLEFEQKHYVLNGLNVEVKGHVAGFDAVDLQLKSNADLTPETRFALDDIKLAVSGKQNGNVFKLAANGQASADLAKHAMSSALSGNIDESHFDAKLGMTSFSPAAYTFNIDIDRFDADRYMKEPAAAPAGKSPPANAPEQPIDLSALKTLNATGSLHIGALKAENIKASNVRLTLRAIDGKLDVRPFSAQLYGGTAAGSMSVDATAQPRFGMQQKLANIQVGNLLKDAIGKEPIDGKGDVQLDVHAQGNVVSRIKKSLDGTAGLELSNGAIYGINIAKSIRDAKTKLNVLRGGDSAQAGAASKEEKTDFSEMSASFRIANGVAHNDDLSAKSPLVRLGGSGDVDIGESRIDYVVKATVVSSLEGQGGPELQALKGLTVPVKLSGPFDAIGWKIDFGGIVGSATKQKIDEKKAEVTEKAKQKIQEQLGDKLKGLFGK